MRKLNSAPALKRNQEKQESRRRTEMPQRNSKLVASLLAEIDTHLNSEDDLASLLVEMDGQAGLRCAVAVSR